jgi:hypothetical protein
MKKLFYLLVLVICMLASYNYGVNHTIKNIEIGNVYDEGCEIIVDEQIHWFEF